MTATQRTLTLTAVLTLFSAAPGLAQNADQPLASAKQESGLIVEVLEIKPDNNEMVMIRWRYRNPTQQTIELIAATPRFQGTNPPPNTAKGFFSAVYYVEGKLQTAQAFKHYIVSEKRTKKLYAKDLGRAAVKLHPNQQFEVWAKFSSPAAGANTICLALPGCPVIEDVPLPGAERAKRQD
jgi:hypothetical protein